MGVMVRGSFFDDRGGLFEQATGSVSIVKRVLIRRASVVTRLMLTRWRFWGEGMTCVFCARWQLMETQHKEDAPNLRAAGSNIE